MKPATLTAHPLLFLFLAKLTVAFGIAYSTFSLASDPRASQACSKPENKLECTWISDIQSGRRMALDLATRPEVLERVKKNFSSSNFQIKTTKTLSRDAWFGKMVQWYDIEKRKVLNHQKIDPNTGKIETPHSDLLRYINTFPEDWKQFRTELAVRNALGKPLPDEGEKSWIKRIGAYCKDTAEAWFAKLSNLENDLDAIDRKAKEFAKSEKALTRPTVIGKKIVAVAKQRIKKYTSGHMCLAGVEYTLKAAFGDRFPFTGNRWASMTTQTFRNVSPYNKLFKEVQLSKEQFDQGQLPPGAILVWKKSGHPGHIEIYGGKGNPTYSDFINLRPSYYFYGAPTIFIPR